MIANRQLASQSAGVPGCNPCKSILLVDDSAVVRGLYAEVLQGAGYRVVQAVDGHEARCVVENAGHFDLLLTDYQMPRMNGAELALWFHERWPATPVLIVSASPEHLKHATQAAPFAATLHKTSSPAELLAAVDKLLQTGSLPDAR